MALVNVDGSHFRRQNQLTVIRDIISGRPERNSFTIAAVIAILSSSIFYTIQDRQNVCPENSLIMLLQLPSLKAMRQTYEAGIRTVCFVSPIFPRITDVKAIIEEVKDYACLLYTSRCV